MNKTYNFNDYPTKKKSYGGANGNKLSIIIDNELYMLKLPQHASKNEELSYANSSISENHKEFLKKIISARKDIIIDKNLLQLYSIIKSFQ